MVFYHRTPFPSIAWIVQVTSNADDDRPPSAVKRGKGKRLKSASPGPVDRLVREPVIAGN